MPGIAGITAGTAQRIASEVLKSRAQRGTCSFTPKSQPFGFPRCRESLSGHGLSRAVERQNNSPPLAAAGVGSAALQPCDSASNSNRLSPR
jgi:hypothetical protein